MAACGRVLPLLVAAMAALPALALAQTPYPATRVGRWTSGTVVETKAVELDQCFVACLRTASCRAFSYFAVSMAPGMVDERRWHKVVLVDDNNGGR